MAKKGNKAARAQAPEAGEGVRGGAPVDAQPQATAKSGGGDQPNGAPADPLVDFAEDLGAFLGTVQTKASSWLEQRKVLADRLTQIRDTANEYLQQLAGQSGQKAGQTGQESGARRGRPPGSGKKPAGSPAPPEAVSRGKKGKRTMSPEARERIAAAQRERWAKVRKGQGR